MKRLILILLIIFLGPTFSKAQPVGQTGKDSLDYFEMSLEELMKLKAHGVPSEMEALVNSLISVASKKALSTRETPSIISLITEDEIRNSGARDLMDVLRLVPGFDFAVDVEGVVGIGIRGNWSNEGKVLMLLDGQEMNEILFASNQLGNRIPVDLIKRIEIIRGPGSAIYGGYAEYGVINIVTKQAEDVNGVFVSGMYGQMWNGIGPRNFEISAGRKIRDFSISLSGFLGRAQRSDGVYRDYNGDQYTMNGNSALNADYLNLGIKYKSLSFRFILDNYMIDVKDGFGYVVKSGSVVDRFNNIYSELKNEFLISPKWKLSSKLNFKSQEPWKNSGYEGTEPYSKQANRASCNVTAIYDPTRHFDFSLGVEGYYDMARSFVAGDLFHNGKSSIDYYNYSMFAQSLLKTKYVNFVLGARFDNHSAFGSAFVPRVGLTKKINKFHYKVLFGRSFRAPSIENINDANSTSIKPEFTDVLEVELGYQLTRNSILSANVFDIATSKPIVYYSTMDSVNTEYYMNYGSSGTQGIEAEYRFKLPKFNAGINYAFYSAANKSKISSYQTNSSASLLAFANHRINVFGQYNISKNFSTTLSASFYSGRWAVTGYDSLGNSILSESDPILLLNAFFQYKLPKVGLNVGLGMYDILDQKCSYIQPYDGGHAPLPGPSRELIVRLQYILNFKKETR